MVADQTWRFWLEELALDSARVIMPVALDTTERLTSLPAGHALRSLCRVAWSDGDP